MSKNAMSKNSMSDWADRALIRRDPDLPGLAVVLDPDAFVVELARELPELAGSTAEISYLRYKPGRSCLVGYRIDTGRDVVDVHAKAHRPDARDKLGKYRSRDGRPGALGFGYRVLDESALVIACFPNDRVLRTLPRLVDAAERRELLRKRLPKQPTLWSAALQRLRYKPERRYVVRLSGEDDIKALLKTCNSGDYHRAMRGARGFASRGPLKVARLLGHDDRRRLLVVEWLPGRPLDSLPGMEPPNLEPVGAALAELHAQNPAGLAQRSRAEEADALRRIAADVGAICPELKARLVELADRLAYRLLDLEEAYCPLHGDFHIEQVLINGPHVALIDLDQAARGDPAADPGSFLAGLECEVLSGGMTRAQLDRWHGELIEGYRYAGGRHAGGELSPQRLALYTACGLLARAPEPFRQRWPDWPERTAALLDRAAALLGAAAPLVRHPVGDIRRSSPKPEPSPGDPAMPFLHRAFDPCLMQGCLRPVLVERYGESPRPEYIRMRRHRAGLRCLIEYGFADGAATPTLFGKVRAKGLDRTSHDLQLALRRDGFGTDSADGIAVPEPVGTVPELHMWLQERVPGEVTTDRFDGAAGNALVVRIAEAAHKLHRTGIPTRRRHTLADELRILFRGLDRVAERYPRWQARLEPIARACERLAAQLPESPACGIHRDFYPDQVLVDGERLYLLDLDLYCIGDPALDIGNFIAHMAEYGLRIRGDIDAFEQQQQALETRFLALNARASRTAVQGYVTLSLARHIAISTRISERRGVTEALMAHCEQRLRKVI